MSIKFTSRRKNRVKIAQILGTIPALKQSYPFESKDHLQRSPVLMVFSAASRIGSTSGRWEEHEYGITIAMRRDHAEVAEDTLDEISRQVRQLLHDNRAVADHWEALYFGETAVSYAEISEVQYRFETLGVRTRAQCQEG